MTTIARDILTVLGIVAGEVKQELLIIIELRS